MKPAIYVRFVWHLLVFALLFITSIPSCNGLQDSHGHGSDADIRNLVKKKLIKVFENSDEDLARVLYFLESASSSHWRNLETLINSEGAFKSYAQQLADDAKTARNNYRSQNTHQHDVKDIVRKKLVKVFEDSEEDLVRILLFLEEKDKLYQNYESASSSHWKNLEALIDNERAFNRYAQELVDETKTADNNPRFLKAMHDIYENGMGDASKMATFGFIGFARAWEIIPAATKSKIVTLLPRISMNNHALITTFGNTVGFASKIGLDKVYLTWEALRNIYRWWTGELSGKRCAKNIVDATITTAAGVAGGVGGATMGLAFGGPIGGVVGGIVGATFTSSVASSLIDLLTQHLFGLPQEEALEKAYDYLGVEHTAFNTEINKAYRRLCLRHHPDKGGDVNKYYLLQNSMAIIRLARGEH